MHTKDPITTRGLNGRLKLDAAPAKLSLVDQLDVEKQGKLKVLVRHEGNQLVAQCLQYDFAVHGSSMAELKHRLAHVLVSHVLLCRQFKKLPFVIGEAPASYTREWDQASHRIVSAPTSSHAVEDDSVASYVTEVVERAEFAIP